MKAVYPITGFLDYLASIWDSCEVLAWWFQISQAPDEAISAMPIKLHASGSSLKIR
jgi:hypothetical protein